MEFYVELTLLAVVRPDFSKMARPDTHQYNIPMLYINLRKFVGVTICSVNESAPSVS